MNRSQADRRRDPSATWAFVVKVSGFRELRPQQAPPPVPRMVSPFLFFVTVHPRVHPPQSYPGAGTRNGHLLAEKGQARGVHEGCTGAPWPVISAKMEEQKNSALPGLSFHKSPTNILTFPCPQQINRRDKNNCPFPLHRLVQTSSRKGSIGAFPVVPWASLAR